MEAFLVSTGVVALAGAVGTLLAALLAPAVLWMLVPEEAPPCWASAGA